MSPDPTLGEQVLSPGGIWIPPTPCVSSESTLDATTAEFLRAMSRDYQNAPPGTPEQIRPAYEAIAAAMLEAEHLRILMRQLHLNIQRHATATRGSITRAAIAYEQAKLHLGTPDGGNAFADANHRLDNIAQMLDDPERLTYSAMFGTCPPLDAGKVLPAMQAHIAAIVAAKLEPPRRVGASYIIEGYTLELSEQTATLLEMGLRERGTHIDGVYQIQRGTHIDEVYQILGIERNRPASEITARVAKLNDKLHKQTKTTPFLIHVNMSSGRDGSRIVATIKQKQS